MHGFLQTKIIRQFSVGKYLIDFYIPVYAIAIEFDEEHHKRQIEEDLVRQKYIEDEFGCVFVRVDSNNQGKGLLDIQSLVKEKSIVDSASEK